MFSYDFIVAFIGFCSSLVILTLVWSRRTIADTRGLREFVIINGVYVAYLLSVVVLNYFKFYESYENAFWLTTEVWVSGVLSIAVLGWRLVYFVLFHYSFSLSRRLRVSLDGGFIVALLLTTIGYIGFRQKEGFELIAAIGPVVFFAVSLLICVIYLIFRSLRGSTKIRSPFMLVAIFLLLLALPIDGIAYILPFTLYPYAMLVFQITVIVLFGTANRGHGSSVEWYLSDLSVRFGTSKRESELIALLLEGKSRKEIADELCISVNTVKTHTHNIYRKIHVSSRTQLLADFYKGSLEQTGHTPKG